eukprot:Rhum_TRINITY_DN13372_c0_g1::Rhum_TRINITY_DN13372_c0_g1_i1::g.59606::m.59606
MLLLLPPTVLAAREHGGEEDRYISTAQMLKGFNDLANEADTEVTGGQSVINPWPMIGGVAMSVVHRDDFSRFLLVEIVILEKERETKEGGGGGGGCCVCDVPNRAR